jgi:hypothetical protein
MPASYQQTVVPAFIRSLRPALVWKDPGTERHGRQGQPQGGIDIYGRPDGKSYTGVQCKNKDIWPAKELTTNVSGIGVLMQPINGLPTNTLG